MGTSSSRLDWPDPDFPPIENLVPLRMSDLLALARKDRDFYRMLSYVKAWSTNFEVYFTAPFFGTPEPKAGLIGDGSVCYPYNPKGFYYDVAHLLKPTNIYKEKFYVYIDRTERHAQYVLDRVNSPLVYPVSHSKSIYDS